MVLKLRDPDDILYALGDPGKFQVIQIILLAWQFLPTGVNDLMPIFYNFQPIGIRLTNDSAYNTSEVLNITAACQLNRNEFDYVYPANQWSIIGDMDLVCDRKWLADFASTIYFLGQVLGSPVVGFCSDRYGRRPTLIWFNAVFTVLNIGLIFSRDIVSFIVIGFFVGVARQAFGTAFVVIAIEWIQPKRRALWWSIAQFPLSLAVPVLALAAYLLPNWHYLQIFVALSNFTAVTFYWFAPESLKWLMLNNRVEETKKICQQIADFNKMKLPAELFPGLEKMAGDIQARRQNSKPPSAIDCFRTTYVRTFTLMSCYLWFAVCCTYFTLSFLLTKMTGDIYINLTISGCLELIPRIFSVAVAMKVTNRASLTGYYTVAGILAIAAGSLTGASLGPTKTGLALVGRMAISGCFPVIGVLCNELLPTAARNSGIAWCSVFMRIGGMVAPQLVLLTSALSFKGVPYLIVGIVSIIAAGITVILPETSDMKLLTTVEEMEKFGAQELFAFYRRKSVAVLTFLKTARPSVVLHRASMAIPRLSMAVPKSEHSVAARDHPMSVIRKTSRVSDTLHASTSEHGGRTNPAFLLESRSDANLVGED